MQTGRTVAAFRRRVGQHPFIGGFLGAFLFGGVAIFFGTSAIFALIMAIFGFILGAGLALKMDAKQGNPDEVASVLSDGRSAMEKVRGQVPYNQGNMVDPF